MARPQNAKGFTLSQLEDMLEARRSELEDLSQERVRIVKQLAIVDEKIIKLGRNPLTVDSDRSAPANLTTTGRARNSKSLVTTMEGVLTSAPAPMKVGEIVQAVQDAGYRSNSSSFRAIVNQTLIKERKRFVSTGRATYTVKK